MTSLGLSELVPSLDIHVRAALEIQDAFERWVEMPQGPPPLVVKPWHNPQLHLSERIKWLNTDRMRELLAARPDLEPLVIFHLQELQMLAMPPMPVEGQGQVPSEKPPTGGVGGARAMRNSNRNAGSPTIGAEPPEDPYQTSQPY